MGAIKIHISLSDRIRSDPEARRSAVQRLASKVALGNVNMSRLERFGILTAEVDPDAVEIIRSLTDVVRSVTMDSVKRAV